MVKEADRSTGQPRIVVRGSILVLRPPAAPPCEGGGLDYAIGYRDKP